MDGFGSLEDYLRRKSVAQTVTGKNPVAGAVTRSMSSGQKPTVTSAVDKPRDVGVRVFVEATLALV